MKTFALFCVRFYSPDRRIALLHIYRSFPTAGNERTWKLTSSASVVFLMNFLFDRHTVQDCVSCGNPRFFLYPNHSGFLPGQKYQQLVFSAGFSKIPIVSILYIVYLLFFIPYIRFHFFKYESLPYLF